MTNWSELAKSLKTKRSFQQKSPQGISSSLCVHSSIHKTFYGSLTFRVITIRGHSGISPYEAPEIQNKEHQKTKKNHQISTTIKHGPLSLKAVQKLNHF